MTLMVDQIPLLRCKGLRPHLSAPAGYGVYDGEPAGGIWYLPPRWKR